MRVGTRNLLAKSTTILLAGPALLVPAACLLFILYQGGSALNWQMLGGAAPETSFGATGALWPQILGSLLLMLGACLFAAPVAQGIALFHVLRASRRQQALVIALLNLLQGIPPIVYGLCGLIVLVHMLRWGVCLLTGMVILAVIILPLLVLNTIHAIERVPAEHVVAARSLGMADHRIVGRVWLAQAWPAMLTGLLLGMARALAETAPILFTATVFSGVTLPNSVFSPVTSLQTHVFYLAQEGANARALEVAWAAALVLVVLILTLSLGASALRGVRAIERKES